MSLLTNFTEFTKFELRGQLNSRIQTRDQARNQSGFTLIELLVVIVIIGILSTIGINNFITSQMKARDAQRKSDLQNLSKALEMYFNDKGRYPDSYNGLIKVNGDVVSWGADTGFTDTTVPNGAGAVYMAKMPRDPGGSNPYYYSVQSNGTGYKLYARLENTRDIAVVKDESGVATTYSGTACGEEECNYGVASSNLTL